MLKKSSLTCAIILLTGSCGAVASDISDFLTSGTLDMELRTIAVDRNRSNNDRLGDEAGAAQGVRFLYTTGKLFDRLSLTANYYQSIKLYGPAHQGGSIDLLEVNEQGDQDSYQKLALSTKLQLTDNSWVQAGHQMMGYPLLNDNNVYITPGLTEAINAEWTFDHGRFYAVHATGGNLRSSTGFEDYQLDGRKKPVSIAGIDYNFGTLGSRFEASAGQQDDFANHYWLRGVLAEQFSEVKLVLDNRFFGKTLKGATRDKLKEGDDDSSWFASSLLTAHYGDYSLSYGFQKVSKSVGFRDALAGTQVKPTWHRWAGGNDFTRWGGAHLTRNISFDRNDMDSHSLRFDHSLNDIVPGLQYFVRYTEGDWTDHGKTGKTLTDREVDFNLIYNVQNPALKGLSAMFITADTTEEKVTGGEQRWRDLRAFLIYRKSLI